MAVYDRDVAVDVADDGCSNVNVVSRKVKGCWILKVAQRRVSRKIFFQTERLMSLGTATKNGMNGARKLHLSTSYASVGSN